MGNIPSTQAPKDKEDQPEPRRPSPQLPVEEIRERDEYIGERSPVDGLPHGKGVVLYATRDPGERSKYTGEFKNGRRHGRGVLIWRNGSRYDGEWVNDRLSGEGHLLWNTGMEYKGEWLDNKFHGHGIMRWPNNKVYDGQWVQGKRTGYGVFKYPPHDDRNREVYVGNWLDDKRSGEGIMRWRDGSEYIGYWLNGKRHGLGHQTFPNGDEYKGNWKDGRRWGNGLRKYPDGSLYEGEWRDDKRHGRAKITEPWGRVSQEYWDLGIKIPVQLPQDVPSLVVLCVEQMARDPYRQHRIRLLPAEMRALISAYQNKRGVPIDPSQGNLVALQRWVQTSAPIHP